MGAPVGQLPEYTIRVTSWAFGGGEAAATTTSALSGLAAAAGPAAAAFIAFDIITGLIFGSFEAAVREYDKFLKEWGARDPVGLQLYANSEKIASLQHDLSASRGIIPAQQQTVMQQQIVRLEAENVKLLAAQQAASDIVAANVGLAELPIYAPVLAPEVAATYLPVAIAPAVTGATAAVAVPAAAAAAAGILPAVAKGAALTTMLANAGLAIERAIAPLTNKLPAAQQTIQENPGTFMIIVVALIFILLSRE